MKNILKHILILIIIVIIFIIQYFYKTQNNVFDDITILSLWSNIIPKSEYEILSHNKIEIDVFSTIDQKKYKKIAPGSKGSFTVKFKRPIDSIYKIKITEKTSKPRNLVFIFQNKKYESLEKMEDAISNSFLKSEKITIYWEWEYYVDEENDIQDTEDGQTVQRFLFEVEATIEETERNEI